MKKAFVFLADGFEDVEAITPIDFLRRAGVDVTVVGVTGRTVVSSHHVPVVCDRTLPEMTSSALPDLVVLPGGGKGSENLATSGDLKKLVTAMMQEKRLVGAICAAPAVVLGGWGLLEGRRYTCFPGTEKGLRVKPLERRVVTDDNLITARAAGTAEEFSLELIRLLCGDEAMEKVSSGVIAR